jgi:hypothetical protein
LGSRAALASLVVILVTAFGAAPALASAPLVWSPPTSADTQTPYGSGRDLTGVACPGVGLCVAMDQDGNAVTSTDPSAGTPTYAVSPVAGPTNANPIACPTTSFCIAVAGSEVYVSQDPGEGTWSSGLSIDQGNTLVGVSCDPTVAVCVAVDGSGNELTTTDPTDASPTWTSKSIDSSLQIDGVSCPSTTLCVAVDEEGNVLTSADPGAVTPIWSSQPIDSQNSLEDVSCAPGTTTCVAVGAGGSDNVFSTTTPGGSWNSAQIDGNAPLRSVSCGSATLCAVGDSNNGNVLVTNDPGDTMPVWSSPAQTVSNGSQIEIGCATSFCVAVDENGDLITSGQEPTSSASTWTSLRLDGFNVLEGVSCPSSSLCAAVDNAGDVLISTNPSAATPTWNIQRKDPGETLQAVSCDPTLSVCVAVDGDGQEVTTTDPTTGPPTWSAPLEIDGSRKLVGVSCPAADLCVAVDTSGYEVTSNDPTDPNPTWTAADIVGPSGSFAGISCPSTGFCAGTVNTSDGWELATSSNPTADPPTWSSGIGDPGVSYSISCLSSSFCLAEGAFNGGEDAAATTDPSDTIPTWDFSFGLSGPVDCPTAALCVAVNAPTAGLGPTATSNQTALLGDEPETAWSSQYNMPTGSNGSGFPPDAISVLYGVSCSSDSFCMAVDGQGNTITGGPGSTLSVTIAGAGAGQVSGSELACTSSCTQSYQNGTDVTLTAASEAGSVFTGWSGGVCSGTGTCQVTMSSDRDVTASFAPLEALSVAVHGSGKVTGSGISCPGTCAHSYASGTAVTLTATPASGWAFVGWSGACTNKTGTCHVTMTQAESVSATFTRIKPPTATITKATTSSQHRSATFAFRATGTVSRFECALDESHPVTRKPPLTTCHSPKAYTGLGKGTYTFMVRGVNAGGTGPAASRTFKIS